MHPIHTQRCIIHGSIKHKACGKGSMFNNFNLPVSNDDTFDCLHFFLSSFSCSPLCGSSKLNFHFRFFDAEKMFKKIHKNNKIQNKKIRRKNWRTNWRIVFMKKKRRVKKIIYRIANTKREWKVLGVSDDCNKTRRFLMFLQLFL